MSTKTMKNIILDTRLFIRLTLAAGFLSAVADRCGAWGPPGEKGVAWGSFNKFLEYTHILNPWAPRGLTDLLGYFVTASEITLGVMLILGIKTRLVAMFSFFLLNAFAFSMAIVEGVKSPLDYGVFTAAAAALLLYSSCEKAVGSD